ncbi:MAG: neutral zinc metallopeptidase [Acidimicrobiia bacterium]
MRFRRGARLDPGQVRDVRGRGLGPIGGIGAGGGIIGLVVAVVLVLMNGGGGGVDGLAIGGEPTEDLSAECQTGADANQVQDCLVVGVVNSVQEYWSTTVSGYHEAPTTLFSGQVQTGCGVASSAVGPFYCPADESVYVDLGFFDDLESRCRARGGPFAEAYVIGHEYGHHVQHLLGTSEQARDGSTGPTSSSVRLELQADCYAGAWANNAVATGYVEELTADDIARGLDAAAAVGDDRIQERVEGRVDPEAWTHGSAEQRQAWFTTGYETGDPNACDTFDTTSL